jgi:glycosyltransferase involved in cell wall biosynthesis
MRVVFVQKFVPHYRLPFFERVRDELARQGIEFVLIYGSPDPFEESKVKMAYPDWGIHAKTRHVGIAGRYLYWKNAFRYIQRGDFVVVEHAAKLLDNYLIFFMRQLGYLKMGYFGHGHNFQATTEYRVSAVLKRLMVRKVDRWFAYTEVSRESLLNQAVADAQITVVNNTLVEPDNAALGKQTPDPLSCVYVGGMYELKLLPLLIDAATRVAEKTPGFELHMVGDGPDKPLVDEAAKSRPWFHVHGSLYGLERDRMRAQCSAILMPGLVGLIAIDSFQFTRPVITSDAGEHSPEIAYLEHEHNCLIDQGDVTAASYAELVLRFLNDTELQQRLRDGCRQSASLYSIDNMAANFCAGVLSE